MPQFSNRALVPVLGAICVAGMFTQGALADGMQTVKSEPEVMRPDAPVKRGVSAKEASIVPLTGRFSLNGDVIDYGTRGNLTFGGFTSSDSNSYPALNGTLALSEKLSDRLNGNLYTRHQSGWYLQFKTIDRRRETSVVRRDAVSLTGYRLQLSVTGDCMGTTALPGQLCTYTPGLATDPALYDLGTLVPTGFVESTVAGEVISQETYDALLAEGFQRGVDGGDETVGTDLDVQNSGMTADIANSGLNGVGRSETISQRLVPTLSKFDQWLATNDSQAALARTVRSFVFLRSGEWSRDAVILQAAAWLLPGMRPGLAAGADAPNLDINNNLFYAANNLRVPANSFSVFETGRGTIRHPETAPKSADETPVSYYNGFWMGFSPVRSSEVTQSTTIVTTGDRITTSGPYFNQGAAGIADVFSDSAITIIDDITNQITQIQLSGINNLFVQSGLELTAQAALAYSTTREVTSYALVPHLAFSGNRTDGRSVTRYYAGVLLKDDEDAYIGADYTRHTAGGYVFTAKGEAHSAPDRDYYSFAEARLTRTSVLSGGQRLTLGIGGRHEFDRPETATDEFDALSSGSVLDLLGRYQTGPVSYDARLRYSDEEEGDSHSLTLSARYRLSDRLSITGQITPISDDDAYIRASAGVVMKVGDGPAPGTLSLQLSDIRYDYGTDSAGGDLKTSNRTLLAAYQIKF